MTKTACLCIIFASFLRLIEGNNVTLLPKNGTANVVSGGSLTLECIYSGDFIVSTFNFYLYPDTGGLQIRNSTCRILFAIGYNTNLYSHSCGTKYVNLTILTISEANNNERWDCDVSLTTADPEPPKDSTVIRVITPITTTATKPSTTTTTTTTVTSSSTSMSSATSSVTIDNTSTNPTTNGSAASATSSTSTSMSPTSVSPANNTNNTSISTKPTLSESTTINNTTSSGSKNISSGIDIKVIVPAVVVPCGLLIIGGIILVVCCVRRRTGKTVCESPDGIAVQDKGNNIEGWKQSQGHGKATDNLDAVYTTPDGFIIYPGPAAMSTARLYKDKKNHGVTDQYSRPYAGPYHHQAEYFPSTYTYTSARAYTHKDKKHQGVTDQYSRPYTGTYGYQAGYVPSTYKSARTYPHKGRNYDYEGPIPQPASHQMASSRLAYDQTTYYPQTGYYEQSSQDVYYSGGGQYSYGHRSRSHHHHSGRKQQREYYNQNEMADYGGSRAGYRHTKQDTALYY